MKRLIIICFVISITMCTSLSADAQRILDRAINKAKEKLEQKAEEKVEQKVEIGRAHV